LLLLKLKIQLSLKEREKNSLQDGKIWNQEGQNASKSV
jgi:hypothetical protein